MKHLIDRDIVAEEDRLTQATRGLDVETLARLYADDIMFTGVTGVICSKANLLDEARRGVTARQAETSNAPTVVSYDKDDLHGVRHGDTAVTSYRFGVTIRHDGQETIRRYRTTNVWMKRGDAWQVVAAHTAGLP